VERKARPRQRVAAGSVGAAPATSRLNPLANVDALLNDGGQITIGYLEPIACAAIANDQHNSLAMLQRRPGETLHHLLARLDAAIALAWNEDHFSDEINPPSPSRGP